MLAVCFCKEKKQTKTKSSLAANNLHNDLKEDEIPVSFIYKYSFAPSLCEVHPRLEREDSH